MKAIKVGDSRLKENKANSQTCCKDHTRFKAKNKKRQTSLKNPTQDYRTDLTDNKLKNEDIDDRSQTGLKTTKNLTYYTKQEYLQNKSKNEVRSVNSDINTEYSEIKSMDIVSEENLLQEWTDENKYELGSGLALGYRDKRKPVITDIIRDVKTENNVFGDNTYDMTDNSGEEIHDMTDKSDDDMYDLSDNSGNHLKNEDIDDGSQTGLKTSENPIYDTNQDLLQNISKNEERSVNSDKNTEYLEFMSQDMTQGNDKVVGDDQKLYESNMRITKKDRKLLELQVKSYVTDNSDDQFTNVKNGKSQNIPTKPDMRTCINGYDYVPTAQTDGDSNDSKSFNVKWRFKSTCVGCGDGYNHNVPSCEGCNRLQNYVLMLEKENAVLKQYINEINNSFGSNFINGTKNFTSQTGLKNHDHSVQDTNPKVMQNTAKSDENSIDDIVLENDIVIKVDPEAFSDLDDIAEEKEDDINDIENSFDNQLRNDFTDDTSPIIQQTGPKKNGSICAVCGDEASGYNYEALTCEACKRFFRLSVENKRKYSCIYKEECDINKETRKNCRFCRYNKCIKVGMKMENVGAKERKEIFTKENEALNGVEASVTIGTDNLRSLFQIPVNESLHGATSLSLRRTSSTSTQNLETMFTAPPTLYGPSKLPTRRENTEVLDAVTDVPRTDCLYCGKKGVDKKSIRGHERTIKCQNKLLPESADLPPPRPPTRKNKRKSKLKRAP